MTERGRPGDVNVHIVSDPLPPSTVVIGAAPGPELHLMEVGATVQRLLVTDGEGVRRDVALGLPDAASIRSSSDFVGGTIGRYANRIAGGRLRLEGAAVMLPTNDRGHHLHGGPDGFHCRRWTVVEQTADRVTFELVSPDGDQGFPGTLTARARFAIDGEQVTLELTATTTATTVVNLTSHAYFNLHGGGAIDDHRLAVEAATYLPVDGTGIPLGEEAAVAGTPFDLREDTVLGPVVRAAHDQITDARGIDHHYVVDGRGWRRMATLLGPRTGLRMELWSDQPGVQVYTGNFFDGTSRDRTGRLLRQGDGIALEPQLAPDTPNHPRWPSAVLRPGETYRSRIGWVFAAGRPA